MLSAARKAACGAAAAIMSKPEDIRDRPAYTVPEAAGYLKMPAPTLRSWVQLVGRPDRRRSAGPDRLIEPACENPLRLSFNNLVECHTLRALRTKHGVSIQSALVAKEAAKRACSTERLFLSDQLLTNAGEVFLEKYGDLTNVTKSGQLAMKAILKELLKSIDRDEFHLPKRFHPVDGENRIIAIDPYIAFGRPVISCRGISTGAIVARLDANETEEEIANDYNLTLEDIRQAAIYERAA